MQRCPDNPIITRRDIPESAPHLTDVSAVFNPAAARVGDDILLILRVQNRGRETVLMTARSADGEHFAVDPEPITLTGFDKLGAEIYHIYDPRLTRLEDRWYVTLSLDTNSGSRVAIAQTADFRDLKFRALLGGLEARNGVLFPERIGGRYCALTRPNRVNTNAGVASGEAIHLLESHDLMTWIDRGPVMRGRPHFWDELIGPGPPPVATDQGWLLIYHGIATHFSSVNVYQAGVALFDLSDPSRLVGRSRYNILEPRETYELTGQVPNVVFPSGMVVEGAVATPDSRVAVYYGAADTVVGLAETTVSALLGACETPPAPSSRSSGM